MGLIVCVCEGVNRVCREGVGHLDVNNESP